MRNPVSVNKNPIFKQDAANTFVPWIMGLMIFLAILALAGTHLVSSTVNYWDKSFTPGFTVEIPAVDNPFANETLKERQEVYTKALENLSGVQSVKLVSKSYLSPFADPFSEEGSDTYLLDVTLRPDFDISKSKVKALFPSNIQIKIREHREWRQSSIAFAYTATLIGIIIASIIALAAVATIAFVASTGLQVHNRTIEILHLVGARRNYIAQQFQKYAFKLALKGSYFGLLMVAATMGLLVWKIGSMEVFAYLQKTESMDYFLILLFTPLVGIMLTILSARLTVMNALAKSKAW